MIAALPMQLTVDDMKWIGLLTFVVLCTIGALFLTGGRRR